MMMHEFIGAAVAMSQSVNDRIAAELRASAEMRDRIAAMLDQFAARKEATRDTSRKGPLLRAMAREVRAMPPCPASDPCQITGGR